MEPRIERKLKTGNRGTGHVGNFDERVWAWAGLERNGASDGSANQGVAEPSLAGKVGAHLSIEVVEVVYGPGQSSSPHSHPWPVIGVVTAGSLKMQVKGEPQHLYKAGDTFYEPPNGVHLVSANASSKMPAKFLAYLVCDRKTELSVPVGPN